MRRRVLVSSYLRIAANVGCVSYIPLTLTFVEPIIFSEKEKKLISSNQIIDKRYRRNFELNFLLFREILRISNFGDATVN